MAQIQHQGQNANGGVAVPGAAAAAAAGAAAAAAGAAQQGTTSLYVGDLDPSVTDSQLFEAFSQAGQVVSVRVCRDMTTRRSLGYGYVNYATPQDASRALNELNFMGLNGRAIRVMYSVRDPSLRKSGVGNIFIKNLDKSIDHKALHETFSAFGPILSCKVAVDPSGQSKGYGFVQYDTEEAAQRAIEQLNGMLLNDKQVYVGPFVHKLQRDPSGEKVKFTNVYVKNLSESLSDEELNKVFGEFGVTTSCVIMRDAEGKSKGFGFVNFENSDDAARAVEALNGKTFDDKEWFVGKAQKKSERETELKQKFEQSLKEAADKSQGSNLYVKNLDESVTDEKLREHFSPFGTITSCKVMRDPSGVSRGSGFVAFSTPEEASRAIAEMNGKMIVTKPLYVALAQRKEDRKARLQAQFSQMRPLNMPPAVGPRMPMYPPGGPPMGQQLFYGQGPPAMIPAQPGYGYQQQLVPGMRPGPGGSPMPNFFMPMMQQGQQQQQQQQQQRPGGGRRGGALPQPQQPSPMMQQQQMHPRGRMYRGYPQRDVNTMPGLAPNMLSVPYDVSGGGGGVHHRDTSASQPVPIGALASSLANATPEIQRTMLGENLYPLVEQLEPESAAKVTGMLLEMDQTEVLHLLESPDALKAKVAEAMDVLRSVAQQQQAGGAADQLASLSLGDNIVP
ncbi:Polyadenylate-binding protein 8 [Cardamine amara subsp. amara]|uniref:Polyadenylate-binding protein n=1 Tax=Cardamine amara subsp. amara TaxID=228776 RepID=A0ABD1BP98_CARAN